MQLKLNLNGSVEPFAGWLKKFDRIRPSILLEIDTNLRAFVAKTFIEDHSAVRYSSISFDDCNINVVSDSGETDRNGERIKLAILLQLPKLIKILDRFAQDADGDGKTNFDILVTYDRLESKSRDNVAVVTFAATSIRFASPIITMRMDGFRPEELQYLSDETFKNVVFNVQDPYTFELSANTIASIIKTSEIVKVDARRDALVFYVDGQKVYVKDNPETSSEATFNFEIGELEQVPEYAISASIKRENFIRMFDKTDEAYKVTLGHRSGVIDRILYDSLTTPTKIVTSIMNEA